MTDIVVQGQTFTIKGDNPTPREQLAIDTFFVRTKNKRELLILKLKQN